jgi:hypothetical protein
MYGAVGCLPDADLPSPLSCGARGRGHVVLFARAPRSRHRAFPSEQLAAASATPDDGDTATREIAHRKVKDCDTRLCRYRAALDSGADPAVVTTWIAEAQGEKLAAQEVLAQSVRQSSTPAEIRDLIAGLADVTKALKHASGEAKAEVYTALGLRLTYRPNQRQVDVIAVPKAVDVSAYRRGDLRLEATPPLTRMVSLSA